MLLLCAAVVAVTALARADAVSAHAKLVRAQPAPGSTVKKAPALVRLWFDDELDPKHSTVSVWDRRARRVDDGKGGVDLDDMDRRSMIARLRPLAPGVYTVRWKAVSADDRFLAQGTFRFTVAP